MRLEDLSFLDRPTGEGGVRGAVGNSPPGSSEVTRPPDGKRDDGSLAGAFGPSAGQPSTPGTYGRLACTSLANRGSMSVKLDYRGTRIINLNEHTTPIPHVTWVQAAGETVRTARSARGNTGTRAGPNGETGEKCASLTPGSAHCTGKPRGSGWDSGRTKLPNPRAPPMPSDAD